MVKKVRPRWRSALPSISSRARASRASTPEAVASRRHCGISTTEPANGNLAWRSALNTPQ
ncbi:hypothetical protein D3C84_254600 [compost metagenome]